jgi:hypothetical protein
MRARLRSAFLVVLLFALLGFLISWFSTKESKQQLNNFKIQEVENNPFLCLGAHLDEKLFERLMLTSSEWKGTIIAVIAAPNDSIVFEHLKTFPNFIVEKGNEVPGIAYPVNVYRQQVLNLARLHKCEFLFLLDVDFIPSNGLFKAMERNHEFFRKYGKTNIFVVPAIVSGKLEDFASTMGELKQCFANATCKSPSWSQANTNINLWFSSSKPYVDLGIHNPNYEPYFVARTECLPDFDQRFQTWGGDKSSWIWNIQQWGAVVTFLPEIFLSHVWHRSYVWAWTTQKNLDIWEQVKKDTFGNPPDSCWRNAVAPTWDPDDWIKVDN